MLSSSGDGGKLELGWGGGCLALRAKMVASSISARVSSELATRTAPLKLSSSNLIATLLARPPRG